MKTRVCPGCGDLDYLEQLPAELICHRCRDAIDRRAACAVDAEVEAKTLQALRAAHCEVWDWRLLGEGLLEADSGGEAA